MIASYRDPRYAASVRIQQLREQGHDLQDGVPDEVARIYARRVARTAAGGVAIAGFVSMVLAAIAHAAEPPGADEIHPTVFLVGSVALALATYVIVRAVASFTFERRVVGSFDDADDELAKLARLEEGSVRSAAVRVAASGEKLSIGLPMAGISLLAPLSIHLLVWCAGGDWELGSERWLRGFDWWIAASLLLVGIAHVVLALLCARFAQRVGDTPLQLLSAKSPMSGWAVLGWTIVASCIPGLIAFAIPVVVVLITGVAFVPLMFRFMYRRALAERTALCES